MCLCVHMYACVYVCVFVRAHACVSALCQDARVNLENENNDAQIRQ